jgi:phenylalanyl-tRNA synthetase beta chain
MLVPLSLLKKYVPVSLPPAELAHRLTMAGTEIGGVNEIGADWDRDKVLVGHVLKVDPHPDADRLTLPTVDLGGGESITVVCGAPNVAAGQKIAFAHEGARLYSAKSGRVEKLKSAKIRGVLSTGMVCSMLELSLGEDHEGILVLDDDALVGTPLVDYLGDAVLDAEITPNRPDCLSILGIAHEVGAITGRPVTEPDLSYPEDGDPIEEQVKIEITDPELCGRYTASLVSGLSVGPSPRWLQDALSRLGQRHINNIVDITNFVMLEYGQPLHAFDLDTIADRTIVVRAAREGESLATLDDETRKLRPPMLAIANSRDAIALAGVIGGSGTAVTEATTSILLESASFDPINTRRTSAGLRLKTEASYRFERGIRAELAPLALKRATKLILEIAGGTAARGILDIYPGRRDAPVVSISRRRIKQSLGVDFDMAQVEDALGSLGFERAETGNGSPEEALSMKVPYWRSDVTVEDDLVEEVARIVGYDNIPTTMLSTPIPHHEPHRLRKTRETLRDLLAAAGMQEVISYSLTSRETLDAVGAIDDGPEPLRIANPMSSEMQLLRTSLRGSVLQALASNLRVSRGEGIRLFEMGSVYLAREEAKERGLPEERQMLVGLLSGPRNPVSWLAEPGEMNFFDAKGVLESALEGLDAEIEYQASSDSVMHPGRAASLVCAGSPIGVVGEVHSRVLGHFDVGGRVAMFEIDLETLHDALGDEPGGFTSTPKFPESERDFALMVDAAVPSAQVQAMIQQHKLVVRSSPFDVYSGEGVPAGKKSIAYRVVFQSARGTLTAAEVERARGDILRRLEREVGAELRGQS